MTSDETGALVRHLKLLNAPGKHLEVGTAAGGTLCCMIKSREFTPKPQFVVVDTMRYFPGQLETVHQNLRNNEIDPDTVQIRVGTSAEQFTNAEQEGERFDFILIDATHKIRSVMADLKWTRLLTTGGTVCVHDFGERYPGVTIAVKWFLLRNRNYRQIDLIDNLVFLRKEGPSKVFEVRPIDELLAAFLHPVLKTWKMLKSIRVGPVSPRRNPRHDASLIL